jgi:hypothetical protein
MKNRILYCLLFIAAGCGEKAPLSREDFKEKISQSFPSPVAFTFVTEKVYTDTAFDLPAPVYKARVVRDNGTGDSLFFYYFLQKDIQAVFKTEISVAYVITGSARIFECGNVLADTVHGSILVYLKKCPIEPGEFFKTKKDAYLDSSLAANFGFKGPEITYHDIEIEEVKDEPPPPPPPSKPNK